MRSPAWVLVVSLIAQVAEAEFPTTQPFPGVSYHYEQRHDPELHLYFLNIDLANFAVKISLATAGPDPDGAGPSQTTLLPVRQIAQRERFDIAINASYFEIGRILIPEEQAEKSGVPATTLPAAGRGYVINTWASNVGWTMMDGQLISTKPRDDWPIMWVDENQRMHIGLQSLLPSSARQIVTGNGLIMKDGRKIERFESNLPARHPRTVLGIDRTGQKLLILIVDGRRPGVSMGMTGPELATEMQNLGIWDAINLDGGGSTTLLMRDPETTELKLMNQPSDGVERAVSDALGIRITRQTIRPAPAASLLSN